MSLCRVTQAAAIEQLLESIARDLAIVARPVGTAPAAGWIP
jgi:hypothetical protein